jgi:hypothetical protein
MILSNALKIGKNIELLPGCGYADLRSRAGLSIALQEFP